MTMLTRRARRFARPGVGLAAVAALSLAWGCGPKQPPVARPMPPPSAEAPAGATLPKPPAPPEPVRDVAPVAQPVEPRLEETSLEMRSLDELNREVPLKPLLFKFDSAEIDAEGQKILDANGGLLRQYPTWVVTIEGHCDERGTAEYNLALGERRALAARNYLVSIGVAVDRLRTVSYGKEFPFDPGQTEEAYARNRRAHFVITAK
jgi:peptidoglycan-associated lipoprotein